MTFIRKKGLYFIGEKCLSENAVCLRGVFIREYRLFERGVYYRGGLIENGVY